MKLRVVIAGLAAALLLPATARGGDQAYLSWELGEQKGRPTVTWSITGSTKWYVAVVQVASQRKVDARGDFLPENLLVYEVLSPAESTGYWIAPARLPPGTYFGRLKLRFDGPCQTSCQSATSIRSFTIDPPPLRSVRWRAAAGIGKVVVTWRRPGNGWFVGMVVVDDDRRFRSPEDAAVWAEPSKRTRWSSGLLPRGDYYVRLRARHRSCSTCIWTSAVRQVTITRTNQPPRLRPAEFEIVRRDEETGRHWWEATFAVCDGTRGALTLEIRERRGPAGGAAAGERTTVRRLAEPGGCRSYAVTKQSAFAFAEGVFVRVSLRVRDALGAWSLRTRQVTWVGNP